MTSSPQFGQSKIEYPTSTSPIPQDVHVSLYFMYDHFQKLISLTAIHKLLPVAELMLRIIGYKKDI